MKNTSEIATEDNKSYGLDLEPCNLDLESCDLAKSIFKTRFALSMVCFLVVIDHLVRPTSFLGLGPF